MDILFQVTSFFFAIDLVTNALFYLKLFEEKNYNIKRLFIHLRETRRGKSILTGRVAIFRWILIFSYAVTIFSNGVDFYYHLVVFLFYLALFLNIVRRFVNREISLPAFSKIANIAFFLAISLEIILFMFSPLDHFLWILILDKLLLVFISLSLMLLSVFIDFGQDAGLNRAIDKISRQNKLLTVAVVGSYGRGSTKEFISRILSLKFNVLTTQSAYSAASEVAKTINQSLAPTKQIFVAEIDDYRKEDTAEICALIRPKIVVVCGINEQKLSVFMSSENILDSKMEAVSALSHDGIALFNGNSADTRRLFSRTKNKKFMYGVSESNVHPSIAATKINESKFSVSFTVSVLGKSYRLSNIRLLGRQNIENLLPAIFVGVYAGIDFSQIRQKLATIRPLRGTMLPGKTASGAVVIDDTYNANINSVLRALSYMNLYQGKKVLVLEPLVELGKNSQQIHFDLGVEIGKVCSQIFLTNDNYFESVHAGIQKFGFKATISIATPAKIANFVNRECKKEDVIVFVGREASAALAAIKSREIY